MAGTVPHSVTCKSYLYHFTTTVSHYQIHRSQSFCFKNPTALFPMGRKNNISLSDTDEQEECVLFVTIFYLNTDVFCGPCRQNAVCVKVAAGCHSAMLSSERFLKYLQGQRD